MLQLPAQSRATASGSLLGGTLLGAALLAHTGCVRFDQGNEQESTHEALRISASDSVVLCPLSAAASASGAVSVVWAGYPPADDRLQLMHARLSASGELLQGEEGIAELDDELDAIAIRSFGDGLQVQLIEHEAMKMAAIEIDDQGSVVGGHRLPIDAAWISETCEVELLTSSARLRIFRDQVDGEVPLFVESLPL